MDTVWLSGFLLFGDLDNNDSQCILDDPELATWSKIDCQDSAFSYPNTSHEASSDEENEIEKGFILYERVALCYFFKLL
jgi:hypothetical protein